MSVAVQSSRNVPLLIQIPPVNEEKEFFTRSLNSFSQLGIKAINTIRSIPTSVTLGETYNFSSEDLNKHLYGRKEVKAIDIERILRKRKLLDSENPSNKRSRILSSGEDTDEIDDIEMTYSIMSFPNDVQLCLSSIPGHKLGVCSKEHIPAGTWIGPYEGKRVPKGMLPRETADSGFCWEIYKDGKLDHFLDGSDDNSSSWMRYIRCARNRFEQNMHVVQYGPNIYYRSFKDIKPGMELLVWYESQYEQYFGIPMFIKLSSFGNKPTAAVNQVSGVQQNITAKQPNHLRAASSPSYLTKHNGLTLPRQFPPEVSQTFTSSIHYSDWNRQTSPDSSSPPLSASPVASPTDNPSPTNVEILDDKEIGVWKCGQCQERFTQRSALRLHVCPSQANNPFQCGHCSRSFADPTKLRAHVVTHNNERPFKCGFCSRTFAGATTLNNHVRTHTGQKPFVCEKCGKSFSQASQMSRHQRLAEDCQ